MAESNFQQEDDLGNIILSIIKDYQPITTMDVWYELGETYRPEKGITREEVNEILSQMERQKMVIKSKDDKWQIKGSHCL